jgi:hypothetical protein
MNSAFRKLLLLFIVCVIIVTGYEPDTSESGYIYFAVLQTLKILNTSKYPCRGGIAS